MLECDATPGYPLWIGSLEPGAQRVDEGGHQEAETRCDFPRPTVRTVVSMAEIEKEFLCLEADETTASTSLGVRGLGLGVSELTWWFGAFGAAGFK